MWLMAYAPGWGRTSPQIRKCLTREAGK
jgi:hypothetical protein